MVRRARVFFPRVPGVAAVWLLPADVCVADVPLRHADRLARLADCRTTPLVFQHVELLSDWFARRSRPREARRLVERYGYTCSVSRELADARLFYERMYVQHAKNQFGDLANIKPFAEFERRLAQGLASSCLFGSFSKPQ